MTIQFDIACGSNVGQKRKGKPNQDSVLVIKPLVFTHWLPTLVVADGMGGHAGGEIASQTVVKEFRNKLSRIKRDQNIRDVLSLTISASHRSVIDESKKDSRLFNMGSTVVAAIIQNQKIHVINVGDSRLYLFRGNKTQQISYDQSVVAEKVRSGEITEDEANIHPQRNQLTMSISAQRTEVLSAYTEVDLEPEDVILLCSDGLWGTVPINLIRAIACQLKPRVAVKKLIDLANEFGGPDNISVIIARQKDSKLEEVDE